MIPRSQFNTQTFLISGGSKSLIKGSRKSLWFKIFPIERTAQSIECTKNLTDNCKKNLLDEVKTELVNTSANPLTQNADVSNVPVAPLMTPIDTGVSNPFPDQTPYQILTRQYKVGEFAISPGWAGTSFSFPRDLFQFPAIQKALSSFYYFRSNIEIQVKLNSTVYHQGMMMASWEADAPFGRTWTVEQASALEPVTLNYSTSDTITMVKNWICPELYCSTVYENKTAHAIGTLFLLPLVDIQNQSPEGNTTITCTVYASFKQPKVAGFINQPISQSGQGRMLNPEAQQKSETSTLTKTAPSISLRPIFESIPVLGEVYDALSPLLMDKPTTLQTASKMIMDNGTDQIYGRGLDQAIRMSIYPESLLGTEPAWEGVTSNSLWTDLASVPMLHANKRFTQESEYLDIGVYPAFCGYYNLQTNMPDYLMITSSMYEYWRGSIKYFFQFVTNGFTTARFRISYAIDPTAQDFEDGGDFPNMVVDVKGTTMTTMIVPFLAPTVYRQRLAPNSTPETLGMPKIRINMITAPVSQVGSPDISLIVWRSAAEDFRMHYELTSNLDIPVSQCSIRDQFKTRFQSIVPSTYARETGYSSSNYGFRISDSLKKYLPIESQQADLSNFPDPRRVAWVAASADWRQTDQIIFDLFKYKRGSRRFKVFTVPGTPYVGISNETIYNAQTITLIQATNQTPIITVEVPYHAAHYYLASPSDTYATFFPREGGVASIPAQFEYIRTSIADDWQCGYLMPPPSVSAQMRTRGKTMVTKSDKKEEVELKKTTTRIQHKEDVKSSSKSRKFTDNQDKQDV